MRDRRPAADPTVPGSRSAVSNALLPQEVAVAFRQEGLAVIHASLFDAESIVCESSWAITKDGSVHDAQHAPDFAPEMVTIVRRDPPGGDQTVMHQLAPQRWALGWRVDEHRVIVAEVRYRAAHEATSDADLALVRRLCEGRVRSVCGIDAPNAEVATLPGAARDQASFSDAAWFMEERSPGAKRAASATPAAARSGRQRWLLPGLCALALAAGGAVYVQWQHSATLVSEARRMQALSEATLAQSIATTLEHGDYGELQSELDRFEKLRYFDAAVVTNASGRVVAKSDTARDVRIGQVLKPEPMPGSRAIDLPGSSAQGRGRLYIWPHLGTP